MNLKLYDDIQLKANANKQKFLKEAVEVETRDYIAELN